MTAIATSANPVAIRSIFRAWVRLEAEEAKYGVHVHPRLLVRAVVIGGGALDGTVAVNLADLAEGAQVDLLSVISLVSRGIARFDANGSIVLV